MWESGTGVHDVACDLTPEFALLPSMVSGRALWYVRSLH
jgi:hypothetical protein